MASRFLGVVLLGLLLSSAARAERPWVIVTDLHMRANDNSPVPSRSGADSNWALFAAMLEAMHRAEPNPAAVAIGGDLLAHHFPDDTHAAESMMARIAHALGAAYPSAQFFVVLGNNDDPCGDYRVSTGGSYLRDLARIWAPLVNRRHAAPGFIRDFSRRGYYSAQVVGIHQRLLALNSVYWSPFYHSPCEASVADPGAAEFDWLEQTLTQTQMPTILFMHIPPGVDVTSTLLARRFVAVPYLRADATARLLHDVHRSRAPVSFVIAGHMHSGGYRLFGATPILIAPSISPIYGNAPGFLVVNFTNGRIADMILHRYDYARRSWRERLDFDRLFGATAFDAPALRALDTKLAEHPALRSRWERFYNIADDNLWRSFWCAQTRWGDAYVTCTGDRTRVAVFPWLAALVALAFIGLLVWCGMLGAQWIRSRKNA